MCSVTEWNIKVSPDLCKDWEVETLENKLEEANKSYNEMVGIIQKMTTKKSFRKQSSYLQTNFRGSPF